MGFLHLVPFYVVLISLNISLFHSDDCKIIIPVMTSFRSL